MTRKLVGMAEKSGCSLNVSNYLSGTGFSLKLIHLYFLVFTPKVLKITEYDIAYI